MKNRTYKKIFQDDNLLQEMLYLYKIHKWHIEDLAKKFGCDHTSIIWQLKKYDLHTPTLGSPHSKNKKLSRPSKKPSGRPKTKVKNEAVKKFWKEKEVKGKYSEIIDEPICEGKSYKKYLEDDKKNKQNKL